MIQRVVDSLLDSMCISRIFLCGKNRRAFANISGIGQGMKAGKIVWVQNEKGPSMSAYKALKAAGGTRPVLLTTSDHALLASEHVRFFCTKAMSSDADLAVGLAPLDILKIYPGVKRTYYRFRDGKFCTCNLFAFLTRNSFKAARFWCGIETRRKNPVKIVSSFGYLWVLLYLLGRLTLKQGLKRASMVIGCRLGAILMDSPETAIDIDTYNDWLLAETIVSGAH